METSTDGFRILVRDSPVAQSTGTFSSLLGDTATQVEHVLVDAFAARGFDKKTAPMYAQMLVGMVAMTGQWWLDARRPKKAEVAAHLVNLAWNGLSGLEARPRLGPPPGARAAPARRLARHGVDRGRGVRRRPRRPSRPGRARTRSTGSRPPGRGCAPTSTSPRSRCCPG